MPNTSALDALLLQREQLRSEVARVGDMRPGSVVHVSEGAGNRPATAPRKARGGMALATRPLTRVGGKTVTRVIPAGTAVDRTGNNSRNITASGNWFKN